MLKLGRIWRSGSGGGKQAPPEIVRFPFDDAIQTPREDAHVYLNSNGISADSELAVEVLDEKFRPLPSFTAKDCRLIKNKTGCPFRFPGAKIPIRVRVNFTGGEVEKLRLFAIYIQ